MWLEDLNLFPTNRDIPQCEILQRFQFESERGNTLPFYPLKENTKKSSLKSPFGSSFDPTEARFRGVLFMLSFGAHVCSFLSYQFLWRICTISLEETSDSMARNVSSPYPWPHEGKSPEKQSKTRRMFGPSITNHSENPITKDCANLRENCRLIVFSPSQTRSSATRSQK